MNGLLPFERTIEQTTGTMPLARQNNSNCYTRGPVELQAYKSSYTTGEKRTIEQTTETMPLARQNNSNCYTRGPVELQAYKSFYSTDSHPYFPSLNHFLTHPAHDYQSLFFLVK